MSDTKRQYAANCRKPPVYTRFKKGQSGNPRGRPAKNLAALLAAALNEKVTVTQNGKRRQITKREAVIAQLVNNKSASAELCTSGLMLRFRENSTRAWYGYRRRAHMTRSIKTSKNRGRSDRSSDRVMVWLDASAAARPPNKNTRGPESTTISMAASVGGGVDTPHLGADDSLLSATQANTRGGN